MFLDTKFVLVFSTDGKTSVYGDDQYIRGAFDRSLKRLGIDSIDLYYAHRIDKNVSIQQTVGAIKELFNAG